MSAEEYTLCAGFYAARLAGRQRRLTNNVMLAIEITAPEREPIISSGGTVRRRRRAHRSRKSSTTNIPMSVHDRKDGNAFLSSVAAKAPRASWSPDDRSKLHG